jgi:hypothetical protein
MTNCAESFIDWPAGTVTRHRRAPVTAAPSMGSSTASHLGET